MSEIQELIDEINDSVEAYGDKEDIEFPSVETAPAITGDNDNTDDIWSTTHVDEDATYFLHADGVEYVFGALQGRIEEDEGVPLRHTSRTLDGIRALVSSHRDNRMADLASASRREILYPRTLRMASATMETQSQMMLNQRLHELRIMQLAFSSFNRNLLVRMCNDVMQTRREEDEE